MTTKFNIKNFVESNGLIVLADVLSSLYFEENLNEFNEDTYSYLRINATDLTIFNYTKLNLRR